MIKICFFKKQNFYTGFESSGHAGSQMPDKVRNQLKDPEQYGNIFCSAVSVLVYHCQIGLMQIEKIPSERMLLEEGTGNFKLKLLNEIDYSRAQKYFINFLLTLKQLQKKNDNTIIIEEAIDVP